MKNFKRIVSLLLVVMMLLPCLAACSEKGGKGNTEGGGELTETDTVVPDDVKFSGETFTILCREDNAWGNWLHEIAADEDATELVNEAVYKRNLEVEERFDLEEIEVMDIPGHYEVHEDFVNTFRNSILAATGTFDLIMMQQDVMADPGNFELYTDFCDIPYVKDNLDAPYYYQDVNNTAMVNDTLYFLLGDYSLTYWESTYVLYFNKTMAENQNIEDIYGLVRDGKWTFDKLLEMSKGVWSDLNGDLWPGSEDSFGYVSEINNSTDAFASHFDVPMAGRDENGDVIFNVDQGKMVSVLEKFIDFKKSDDTWLVMLGSDITLDENPVDKIFREGRALFYHAMLNRAQDFRGMETDFGIVPYPKWNEDQAGYYTHSQDGYSVAVVPIDVNNVEMCGAVVDVMSALSNKLVVPAYYDMALRDKYARDDESGEMLDIIREGFKMDFAYYYQGAIGSGGHFRNLINQENTNFVSYFQTNKKGFERKLKKLIQAYVDAETE
ncbi:MAG: hypothetical protein IJB24_00610 [Clostridia bacterium]|nr:hypothetical protein [Clostridia bacterium]